MYASYRLGRSVAEYAHASYYAKSRTLLVISVFACVATLAAYLPVPWHRYVYALALTHVCVLVVVASTFAADVAYVLEGRRGPSSSGFLQTTCMVALSVLVTTLSVDAAYAPDHQYTSTQRWWRVAEILMGMVAMVVIACEMRRADTYAMWMLDLKVR